MELEKIEQRIFGGDKEAKDAVENARATGRAKAEAALEGSETPEEKISVVDSFLWKYHGVAEAILNAPDDRSKLGPYLLNRSTWEAGRTIDMGNYFLTLVYPLRGGDPSLSPGPHQHLMGTPDFPRKRAQLLYEESHYEGVLPNGTAAGYETRLVHLADSIDTLGRLASHVGVELAQPTR
jgi:hypothetical protein